MTYRRVSWEVAKLIQQWCNENSQFYNIWEDTPEYTEIGIENWEALPERIRVLIRQPENTSNF